MRKQMMLGRTHLRQISMNGTRLSLLVEFQFKEDMMYSLCKGSPLLP